MVNVICMKWGDKYDAAYVNILRSMVKRNLSLPHRFACFTENGEGIRDDVEVFPLPQLELPDGIPERCWRKLCTFDRQLGDLQGTTLFLDLDVVILDRLEPFFELQGPFFISHDWRWYGKQKVTGNSSCYRFEVGQQPEVLDYFRENSELVRASFRHEQAYLSHKMKERGCLAYWPESWCRSFKAHCMPRIPLRYFQAPQTPPGAKVIIFHGNPNPPDAIAAKYNGIRKFWHPSPWIRDHWHDAA